MNANTYNIKMDTLGCGEWFCWVFWLLVWPELVADGICEGIRDDDWPFYDGKVRYSAPAEIVAEGEGMRWSEYDEPFEINVSWRNWTDHVGVFGGVQTKRCAWHDGPDGLRYGYAGTEWGEA